MPDPTNTAGVTLEAVSKLIADAVKPLTDSLAETVKNQKVLADTMAADAKAKADAEAAAKTEAAKPEAGKEATALTPEAVRKMVADTMAQTLKARDDAAQSSAARDTYLADKMKGVPAAYQSKLGSDPTKWAAEEQAIRDGLKADLAAMGATVKDVSGGNATSQADTPKTSANANLTPGQAAFAAGLVLPK